MKWYIIIYLHKDNENYIKCDNIIVEGPLVMAGLVTR